MATNRNSSSKGVLVWGAFLSWRTEAAVLTDVGPGMKPHDVGSVERIRCWLRLGTYSSAALRGVYSHLDTNFSSSLNGEA